MVQAREIFMGFCRYYNSLNIIYSESLSTHTGRLLSYFDTLGRMLGYRIWSEITMKKILSQCPQNMEKKKVDMLWWRFADDPYELAVESQQSPEMTNITNDIKKLVTIPARLRFLYCASRDYNKIVEAVGKELRHNENNQQRRFLALIDPWVGPDGFGKGTLRGILLDRAGQIIGEGTAKVDELVDGVNIVRVILEPEWRDKNVK